MVFTRTFQLNCFPSVYHQMSENSTKVTFVLGSNLDKRIENWNKRNGVRGLLYMHDLKQCYNYLILVR